LVRYASKPSSSALVSAINAESCRISLALLADELANPICREPDKALYGMDHAANGFRLRFVCPQEGKSILVKSTGDTRALSDVIDAVTSFLRVHTYVRFFGIGFFGWIRSFTASPKLRGVSAGCRRCQAGFVRR